jgi:CRP/FNR family transcriptional regulator
VDEALDGRVTAAPVLDLDHLRRGCARCSLHELCLPASIGDEDLHRLDDIVRSRRPLQPGDRLYRTGQPLTSLYVAREGAFKTVTESEQGDAQVLGFHLPGELIGLDGLGGGEHAVDAVALTRAEVCEIPLPQLESIARQLPGLQRQLMRVIGQGIGRDQAHLEMLGRKQAPERIALFLHGLAERYRQLGRGGDDLMLPMSREDIASYLGIVIETVSRTLSKLQGDRVIEVQGRQIRILDRARLDDVAHR